jgi:hypothetical protein
MAMMAALRACFLTYMKMEATQGENRLNTEQSTWQACHQLHKTKR